MDQPFLYKLFYLIIISLIFCTGASFSLKSPSSAYMDVYEAEMPFDKLEEHWGDGSLPGEKALAGRISQQPGTADTAIEGIKTVHQTLANYRVVNRYNLSQCYRVAIEHNIALKQAANDVNLNRITNKNAQYSILPSLSYNLGHYFSFGKNIDPVTNNFVYEGFSGGYTGVRVQLDLFSGFNRLNTIRQSAYAVESAEYLMKKKELDLLTNVTLAYARLLQNKEQLAVEANNLLSTEAQIKVVNEKIKVGRSTKYEAYLFNSRYNAELANVINLKNDSSSAVQELKQLMNLGHQQEFDIASLDTTILANISASQINTLEFIEMVLQKHPALKQLEMQEEVARIGVKIARSNYFPSLSIGGNISSNYNVNQLNTSGQKTPLDAQLNNNLGQNININLNVPLFSQWENRNKVKREKINIQNARLSTEEAKNAIITNTVQLINEFNFAKEKYGFNSTALELNKLSYSLYEEKYKLGQISSLELLNARDILNSYTARYVQSKLQLYFQFQVIELLRHY